MSSDGDDLPRAHIKRIVKKKLTELMNEGFAGDGKGGKGPDGNVQKEALQAFSECAKIFIHYLTATANDICRDGKRQTISVDDVFKAIEGGQVIESWTADVSRGVVHDIFVGGVREKKGTRKKAKKKGKDKQKEKKAKSVLDLL